MRSLAAVGLVGGAYVLLVVVALLLVVTPLVGWWLDEAIDPILLVATVVGLGLLWTLLPQREPVVPPGPRIDREDQPELWELVETICTVMHDKVPSEIYLLDEMNAYVADVGGVVGFGGRRIMGLGVPLMRVLDVEEFGAVVAHELGHLHRGGAVLGALVYRTRTSIGRTLAGRRGSHLLFERWASWYLRFTRPVAVAQEAAADALAARATSPAAIAGALARLPFGSVAFDVYMRSDYLPVVEAGHQPPFLEGFDRFLSSNVAQQHLRLESGATFGSTAGAPFDGHPPVPERLAALGVDSADYKGRPLPDAGAVALLRNLPLVESQLVGRHVDRGIQLVPIPWADVGRKVLAPGWARERAELVGDLPPSFHLGALPLDRDGLAELGEDVGRHLGRSFSRPEQESYGHHAARAIIGEVAVAAGLGVEMVPGEPVWFGTPPDQFGLFVAYDDVVDGRAEPQLWYTTLDEAGLLPREPVEPVGPLAPSEPSAVDDATASSVDGPPATATSPADVPFAGLFAPLGGRRPEPTMPRPTAAGDDRVRQEFEVPVGMGRRQHLVIDGSAVSWKGESVAADDVRHIAYSSGDVLEVHLWTPGGDLRIRMTANGRNQESSVPAWQALVRWTEALVEGRLVDAHLAELAERGRTTVAEQVVTTGGVVVKGRVVPWSVLAGARFDGSSVVISQRAYDGATELVRLDAREPDVVLLPTLIAAASTSPSPADAAG
ncbi:M48 family metallopeptidase [Actinomarinicola tropica]|uniref:M48 family metallopeptidase n=1 Tax=Actinomarinicola tropica TaxID=2789776 RepID=UPI001898AE50|nr:M48 family metallopeptidase [Actinomarinicola tropica]